MEEKIKEHSVPMSRVPDAIENAESDEKETEELESTSKSTWGTW